MVVFDLFLHQLSLEWSEHRGRKPWKAAVPGHGVENRNRRSLESTASYQGHALFPKSSGNSLLTPQIFGKCFSKKKKSAFFFPWEGRLPPGSSVAPVPHAHFHVVTTARNRELYIVLKSWTGIQNPKHVRNWGFFRCVMLFRIWLLIFNSANILVCLKWSCQLLWSNIRMWV